MTPHVPLEVKKNGAILPIKPKRAKAILKILRQEFGEPNTNDPDGVWFATIEIKGAAEIEAEIAPHGALAASRRTLREAHGKKPA